MRGYMDLITMHIAHKYDMKISTSRTKVMGICRGNFQKSKSRNTWKHNRTSIWFYLLVLRKHDFGTKRGIDRKLQKYNKIDGIIKRHVDTQMWIDIKLCLRNIKFRAKLNYSSKFEFETKWNSPNQRQSKCIFLRPLTVFIRSDHQRNFNIRERFKFTYIVYEIQGYQQNWKSHLERIEVHSPSQLASHVTEQGDSKT
jgi:hypothetical protein